MDDFDDYDTPTNVTGSALTLGSLQIGATYSALIFFQGQAQRPLTDEEIRHVSQKVLDEIKLAADEFADILS